MVILKLLLYLFVLVLVVFLAYYTTKLVGKSAGGKTAGQEHPCPGTDRHRQGQLAYDCGGSGEGDASGAFACGNSANQ